MLPAQILPTAMGLMTRGRPLDTVGLLTTVNTVTGSPQPTWRRRGAAGLALLALMSACGGSEPSISTVPTPGPSTAVPADIVDMNGTWVGTLEFPDRGAQQVTMTVSQFSNCVDGTWRSSGSGSRGALSGFAGKDSYTGLFTFDAPCMGVVQITGSVSGDALRLTGGPVKPVGSGACVDPLPESIVLALRRP